MVEERKASYYIIDTPGQMEIFSDRRDLGRLPWR
jgi:hypothetical protein